MPKQAKPFRIAQAASEGDNDVLHFLTRTLQAHIIDAEPHDIVEKLQNLKTALERQERTLKDWPASASKDRLCAALAKARGVVAQIVDEMDGAPPDIDPRKIKADRKAS